MFDWTGYLDDLHHHLNAVYQIDDREGVNVLLAAMMAVPRTPGCWMIAETNYYSRDCMPAWFSFGGRWPVESMGGLRAMRPRVANVLITGWCEDAMTPRLFIEPDWQRMPYVKRMSEIGIVVARSLRVRVKTPRSLGALAVDWREEERRAEALSELVGRVLEDRTGARGANPPVLRRPPEFAYYAELLQKTSPWYPDWTMLVNALGVLAVHHAYMFGRSEVGEEDWKAIGRVAADSVPVWVQAAVRYLAEHPAGADGRVQ